MPIFAGVTTQKPKCNEHRQCQVTDAQGHARILHHASAPPPRGLCQRHHSAAEGGRADSGGGHALPTADAPEEGRPALLRMAGVKTGTATQVLRADGRRRG